MRFEISGNLNLDPPFLEEVGESTRVLGFKVEEGEFLKAQWWRGRGRLCYLCDPFGLVFNLWEEWLGWF